MLTVKENLNIKELLNKIICAYTGVIIKKEIEKMSTKTTNKNNKNKTSMKTTKQKVDPKVGQVAEGKVVPFLGVEHIKAEELKTFDFESVNQKIEIETSEFSAVCPFSGLPDIAKIHITYYPATKKALELKALKYYFMSYRLVGIYQEGVTYRIFRDLSKILGHSKIIVRTIYNTRGGIDVTCSEVGKQIKQAGR